MVRIDRMARCRYFCKEDRLKFFRFLLLVVIFGLLAGCAYFNTFYNARSYYRSALLLKEQGQSAQAKAKFDKAIEKSALVISRWPRSRWVDDALFLIGRSYYEQSEYRRAIKSFEQLELAFPNSPFVPQAQFYRGLALLRAGEPGAARVVLDGVKAHYPGLRPAVEFYLALHIIESGEERAGLDSLLAFIRRNPRSRYREEVIRQLAEGYFRLKDYQRARDWLERYIKLESRARLRAEAEVKLVQCLLEQEKYNEALVKAKQVLGRYADLDENLKLLIGRAYLAMNKDDEALATLLQVRGNNAPGAAAAFLIGALYEEKGNFTRAKVYYDSARLRRSDSEEGILAMKRLALLTALAEDSTQSRDPSEVKFLLAEVYNLNLEDYDNALKVYQEVADSFPNSPWAPKALFARAWILSRKKADTLGAISVLERIVRDYPNSDYARESKRLLTQLGAER